MVEAVSKVLRMYLLGCNCSSMVTDHANLVHLLKLLSDKSAHMQTRCVEKLMSYANLMRILFRKGILNEANPVPRRPDFLPIDRLYMRDGSLCWDGKVFDIDTNGSDLA